MGTKRTDTNPNQQLSGNASVATSEEWIVTGLLDLLAFVDGIAHERVETFGVSNLQDLRGGCGGKGEGKRLSGSGSSLWGEMPST